MSRIGWVAALAALSTGLAASAQQPRQFTVDPSASDVVVCDRTRFGPLRVSVTLGTAAPLGSVTVPSTVPVVVVCAFEVGGAETKASMTANTAMMINLAFI